MVHKHSYWQMALSIGFIIFALFGATYAIKLYIEKYDTSFGETNDAIQKNLEANKVSDTGAADSYLGMQNEANTVNKMLLLLFFLALILFFIFWLVIMLRRSIIQ